MTIKKRLFLFIYALIGLAAAAGATVDCNTVLVSSVITTGASISAGMPTVTTFTFIVGPDGLQSGDKIALRVPDNWNPPNQYGNFSYGNTNKFGPDAGSFILDTSSQSAILTSISPVVAGSTVSLSYNAYTCDSNNSARFRVFTLSTSICSLFKEGFGNLPSLMKQVVSGPGTNLHFGNYDFMAVVGQIMPIPIKVTDSCNNVTTATGPIAFSLNMRNFDYSPDTTSVLLSRSTSPFSPTNSIISVPGVVTSTTAFYLMPTLTDQTKKLDLAYQPLGTMNQYHENATITNVATGISGASVDKGDTASSGLSVTFSPDQDGIDDFAFINFSIPMDTNWQVRISSISNFSTTTRQFFGFGRNNRISWDGNTDSTPTSPPEIAVPATYYIKIDVNGLPSDTSLSVNLSAAGFIGTIHTSTGAAISNANVEVYGATNRFVRTKPDGSFNAYGLRTGNYNYRISKEGFVALNDAFNISSSGQLINISSAMAGATIVRVSVIRPSSANLPELWGSVNANTTDWKYNTYGSIHFAVNSTTSDAGDMWNQTQTTYTALSLIPAQLYNIKFDIPNLGVDPILNSSFTAGSVIDLQVQATKKANIFGIVCVSSSANMGNNRWVSIEASIDANMDGSFDSNDPTKHYWTGASFQNSTDTCTNFNIFGVSNGTYTILARAPMLAPLTSTGTVIGSTDTFVNIGTMTTGGTLSGLITINGDTTNNPNVIGPNIRVPISAWSPTTYQGSYQEVLIPVTGTVSSNTYTLTGLANGTYNVWTSLPGFELTPPGQRFVTVVNSSASLNLNFNKFGGVLVGSITIPSGGLYSDVSIDLLPYDSYSLQKQSANPVTNSYFFTGLGTGYYTLRARYKPSGFTYERNVQIVNGQTSKVDFDLNGSTFSISGTVRTLAKSPYDTLSYIVTATTPTALYNTTATVTQYFPANRILARRLLVRDDLANMQGGGTTAANNSSNSFDPGVMFFGYYDSSGAYSISNLNPGVYLLSNNGQMDNDSSNGKEIAETASVVRISTYDLTGQDFTLTDGFDIGGRITVDSGISEDGRNITVKLKNAKGDTLVSQDIWLTGISQNFTLNRIPAGTYVLTAEDNFSNIKKYAAKEVAIEIISSSLTNQEIKLLSAAKIQGQLRVKTSGELLTKDNYSQFLPTSFMIEARSNPWFQGGWGRVEGNLIGDDNTFTLSVSPGTYDIVFFSNSTLSADQAAQGKKMFVPITVSGVRVSAGQTSNLGVLDLREGVPVSGTVTDINDAPIPNIRVIASPGNNNHNQDTEPEAFTNYAGSYTLQGLDPVDVRFYDIIAAPRSNGNDDRYSNSISSIAYAESRKTQFDVGQATVPAVNFRLERALGSVSGFVTVPNGSTQPLLLPFDEGSGFNLPGADVIMNKHGDIPQNNPLGNIEEKTNPDGTFAIKGLASGVYDMWVLALNYGSAIKRNIIVGTTDTSVGTMTVVAGYKMSGTLVKADGSPLNSTEFNTIVGVRDGFEEIIVGRNTEDASGNITGYAMSGFQTGRIYSILLFGRNDDVIVLASSVTLTGDTVQNFIVGDVTPVILTQASKNTSGSIGIQFEFTRPLRNSDNPDDNDHDKIIQKNTGTGTLSFDDSTWITPDRKHLYATYTPGAGETSFVLTASCTFVSVNGTTGANYTKVQDFTYFVGIGKQRTVRIPNASGGEAELDEDVSSFETQPGTFGDNSNLEVNVQFRSADDQTSFSGQAALGSSVMSNAAKLGLKAYPTGMAAAIQHLKAMDVDPFGSFYDLILPAGVSHFFPQGKDAKLCLQYDSTVTDPYSLNIYYFNEATNEYLLEDTNKAVDTDNERICVSIAHASVFTILASSQSILSGGGYTGELKVVNFPNPFNLKQKTVTLQDPGSNSASQTIDGTMIKMSIPTTMSGTIEIQIFNVAGEKVRTLHSSAAGGAHYYMEWDGKNESGTPIASGVYIGRFTIGGSNEKFFKMAVVK